MMLRLARVLVVAFLMASPVIAPPTATASGAVSVMSGSSSEALEDTVSSNEALLRDLADIAAAQGWSSAEATAYERSRQAVEAVAARLATERPESFVGFAFSDRPDGAATLYITGKADAFVQGLVADTGVDMIIADGQPWSFAELEARQTRVHRAVLAMGYKQVVTSADITAHGAIRVTVTGKASETADAIRSALPLELRSGMDVVVRDMPVVEEQAVKGGIIATHDQTFLCTTGFTVNGFGGIRGITTAGHCSDINKVWDHIGGYWHTYFKAGEHQGNWGDVEWGTTAEAERDDFHASYSEIRDVSGVKSAATFGVGEFICFWGWGSQAKNCTTQVLNVSINCGSLGHIVQMDEGFTLGGDSGGPWYYGTRAYGGHFGLCSGLSSFTKADYFDEAIGASVALN
jgi:hypothetical protein